MTDLVLAQPAPLASTPGVGAAAERFGRTTLRKSAATQATYLSVYRRFAEWLGERVGADDPPLQALTADAVAGYLDCLEAAGRAATTVRKERSAINRLVKQLALEQRLHPIEASTILMVEAASPDTSQLPRRALDEATWQRVKAAARARLHPGPRARASTETATRDLAIVLCLGELGLRNGEARSLTLQSIRRGRCDGDTAWLHVLGKGAKARRLRLGGELADALAAWERVRTAISQLHGSDALFARVGRRRAADGAFPDAGGHLTERGLSAVVKPIMLAADVPDELAHPHVLRHTFGTLYLRRRPHDLVTLQRLMGHESIDTTRLYITTSQDELDAALGAYHAGPTALERDARRRARRGAAR